MAFRVLTAGGRGRPGPQGRQGLPEGLTGLSGRRLTTRPRAGVSSKTGDDRRELPRIHRLRHVHGVAGGERAHAVLGAPVGGQRDRRRVAPLRAIAGRAPCGSASSRPRRASRCPRPARRDATRCSTASASAAERHVRTSAPAPARIDRRRARARPGRRPRPAPAARRAGDRAASVHRRGGRVHGAESDPVRDLRDRQRQPDDEGRAPALAPALCAATRAAVQLDQVLDDRQPEPEAAVRPRARAVAPGGSGRRRSGRNSGAMPWPVSLTTISTCEFTRSS